MKNAISNIILVALSLLLSCEDILENDLRKSEIELLAPANGLKTDEQNIYFFWEENSHADSYHFQLVSPHFDEISIFFSDTTLAKNQIQLYLNPGNYEWRVKGKNSAYSTEYSISSFIIDTIQFDFKDGKLQNHEK